MFYLSLGCRVELIQRPRRRQASKLQDMLPATGGDSSEGRTAAGQPDDPQCLPDRPRQEDQDRHLHTGGNSCPNAGGPNDLVAEFDKKIPSATRAARGNEHNLKAARRRPRGRICRPRSAAFARHARRQGVFGSSRRARWFGTLTHRNQTSCAWTVARAFSTCEPDMGRSRCLLEQQPSTPLSFRKIIWPARPQSPIHARNRRRTPIRAPTPIACRRGPTIRFLSARSTGPSSADEPDRQPPLQSEPDISPRRT